MKQEEKASFLMMKAWGERDGTQQVDIKNKDMEKSDLNRQVLFPLPRLGSWNEEERRIREVRREGSREMRWSESERRQRKILENRSWGQPQGGCLWRLERDQLCVVWKNLLIGFACFIFNF